jgi:hypothetical protein
MKYDVEWEYYNPNPAGKRVGDCVIRAICKAGLGDGFLRHHGKGLYAVGYAKC